jgi:YfiH family protein
MPEPNTPGWIEAAWPAPPRIRAGCTTREGGLSAPPYARLNLASHVGDSKTNVLANRQRLVEALALPSEPVWLNQVHGNRVINLEGEGVVAAISRLEADGSSTSTPGVVCAVLTADCLPLLLCDRTGTRVAALHCGWRGLARGIIDAGLEAMQCPPTEILAWLDPAIGPSAYEVDEQVLTAFQAHEPGLTAAFTPTRPGHWRLDLYQSARILLRRQGVEAIYGGVHCTCHESRFFYSHRRDGVTGRMASLIWIARDSE